MGHPAMLIDSKLYNPAMLQIVWKLFTENLGKCWDWARNQIGKRSVFALIVIIYCALPDWESRNTFWLAHWPWIKTFVSNYDREFLIVVGIGIIWFDHRRLVKKREPEKRDPEVYDPTSLKGRTLKLRDDIQGFWDSVGPTPEPKKVGETIEEYTASAVETSYKRAEKLLHGYEWRFANDVNRIYNEYGEKGLLEPALTDAVARQFKNEDTYKVIVDSLTRLAARADEPKQKAMAAAAAAAEPFATVSLPAKTKLQSVPARAVINKPNLVATKEESAKVFFDNSDDKFYQVSINGSVDGLVACFRNESQLGRKVPDAEYVAAQVTYLDQSGEELANVGKACWISEYYETIDIPVGEDGRVLLLVSSGGRLVAPYKKSGPSGSSLGGEVVSTLYVDIPAALSSIRVNLIHGQEVLLQVAYSVDVSNELRIRRKA